jgi:hypothetical protein
MSRSDRSLSFTIIKRGATFYEMVRACLINEITNREGRFCIEDYAYHRIPGHTATPRTLPSMLTIRLHPDHLHQFPIQGEFVGGE